MEPARTPRFSRNTPRPSSSRTLRDIRGPTPSRGSQRRRIVSQDACAGAGTSSRLGGPTSGWHLPSRSGAAAWARSDETPALQRTGSSAIPKDGAFSSSPASQPPRTVRGTALRPTSSWCSPPERKSSSSGQRPLCGRRLDRATPTTRRLCRPDRAPRPQLAGHDESESELPIAVDPDVHRHHWRRRPPRAPSTSLSRSPHPSVRGLGAGTTASALPPARVALSQCHASSRPARRGGILVRPAER